MSISNNQYDFKTVSDLIALDHIKEALTKMTEYTKQKVYTKLNNETVQCLSRFSKNENDKNMGVICDLTYKKEHTQIQNAAISLNDDILQYDTLKKEETKRKCQIQVIINGELENFSPEDKLKFKNILAATLGIDSDLVSILEVKEGSIKLTIELPLESAEKLISLFHKKDIALGQLQSEFEIKEIKHVVIPKPHSDQKYIDGLLIRDEILLLEIYKKNFPNVLHHVRENGGNIHDANEVFQQTLLAIYDNGIRNKIQLKVQFGSYIKPIYSKIWLRMKKKKKGNLFDNDDFEI